MKENKFLFYGAIIVTIACAMWLHFHMSGDIEFEYEVAGATDTVASDDFVERVEKPKYNVSYKCETPRAIHHIIYENGNVIAQEYDTYNAQCMCMVAIGNQRPVWFDLEYVDSKMFESKTAADTTARCNRGCQMACDTGFEMFLDKNPNFNPGFSGEFVGCSAQFELQSWANELNGQSTERYYSTNTISCECVHGDEIIEKTETYQYFSEPKHKELDCNTKCAEICSE